LQFHEQEHTMTQATEQLMSSARTATSDLTDMANTTLAGFGKLVELNMATARDAMTDAAAQMQSAFAMQSPQDLSTAAARLQPMAEKAAAYGRAVAGIVTETGTALTQASEARIADMQAQAIANIEAALKSAPAGSEAAVAAFRNAMAASQASLATAQSQAKQAMATAGQQFATASDMAVKATKTAAKAK
jgi:phasin family protein